MKKGGIPKASFTFPTFESLMAGATPTSHLVKCDARDFFYAVSYGAIGRRVACCATRDDTGKIRYFQLQACSMGLTDSPGVCECLASLVCTISNSMCMATTALVGWVPMMDDMALVGPPTVAQEALSILTGVMERVGITEHLGKREMGPRGTLLGKAIDLEGGTVSIPSDKIYKYLYKLHTARLALNHPDEQIQREITANDLAGVTGALQWLSETTVAGGLHLGGLHKVTAAGKSLRKRAWRKLALKDLDWWAAAAADGTLQGTLHLDGNPGAAGVRVIGSDASSNAAAAVMGEEVVWRKLTGKPQRGRGKNKIPGKGEQGLSSGRREVIGMAEGVEHFCPSMPRGTRVALLSDNTAAVLAINKGRMNGDLGAQPDIDRIYAVMQKHGLHIVALFTPREFLTIPDGATKCPTPAELHSWAAGKGLTVRAIVPPASPQGT